MAEQSLLRFIKRWRRYAPRRDWSQVPAGTRGLYVLYLKTQHHYNVIYIGVSGLGNRGRLAGRLRRHNRKISRWSHYSFFEIHDNVTGDELRELETLLRTIFRHDSNVALQNVQLGSKKMSRLKSRSMWSAGSAGPRKQRTRRRKKPRVRRRRARK